MRSFSTKPRTGNCLAKIRSNVQCSIQGEISHREHDPRRKMLLRSAGKLFQDVGYVQASIYRHRICSKRA